MLKSLSILFLFISTVSYQAQAQNNDSIFTDADFTQGDFQDISKDVTSAFSFTTNSGAASLGSIWGVEVGLVAGVTPADNIKRIAKEKTGEAQDELKYLPSGGLMGGVALPFGIGFEANIVPKLSFGDVSFYNTQLAARWEATNMVPIIGTFSPLKIAFRLSYGDSSLDYKNNTEEANMSFKTTEFAAIAGVNLFLLEPYVSLSHIDSSGELNASSSDPLLPNPISRNYDSDFKGTKVAAGVLFKMVLLRFGFEYSTVNDIDRYTAKLSFKI